MSTAQLIVYSLSLLLCGYALGTTVKQTMIYGLYWTASRSTIFDVFFALLSCLIAFVSAIVVVMVASTLVGNGIIWLYTNWDSTP